MVQGHAKLGVSKLGAELTWDKRQSANLEAKVLGEKGTDGPGIFLASG